jgi:hypothetical protein
MSAAAGMTCRKLLAGILQRRLTVVVVLSFDWRRRRVREK